jgi:hypothetical protein
MNAADGVCGISDGNTGSREECARGEIMTESRQSFVCDFHNSATNAANGSPSGRISFEQTVRRILSLPLVRARPGLDRGRTRLGPERHLEE